MFILVENINYVGICCLDDMVIDHYFIIINSYCIVFSCVKVIQYVLRYLIVVYLSFQFSITPGQSLLSTERYEAILRISRGHRAAVSTHWDHIDLTTGDPGKLRQTGSPAGGNVSPVCVLGSVPPVGNG